MKKKSTNFTYENSSKVEQTIVINNDDFDLVQKDAHIHDAKLETKPTTFFKDAIKRFRKNKSSVAGGIILGFIVLLAFVLPLALPYEIDAPLTSETFLEPKLFSAGTGWWDGEKAYQQVVYDTVNEVPAGFEKRAVNDVVTTEEGEYYTDTVNEFAYGGDIRFYTDVIQEDSVKYPGTLASYYYAYDLSNDYIVSVDFNETNDNDEYVLGEYRMYFSYLALGDDFQYSVPTQVEIKDYSKDYSDVDIDLTSALVSGGLDATTRFIDVQEPEIVFELKSSNDAKQCILIHSVLITSDNEEEAEGLDVVSFDDANKALLITKSDSTDNLNGGYWTGLKSKKALNQANIIYSDFDYDTYEVKYGEVENQEFGLTLINSYVEKGYMALDLDTYLAIDDPTDADLNTLIDSFVILDDELCPIRSIDDVTVSNIIGIQVVNVFGTKSLYRSLGYTSAPNFLFGTDSSGHDLLKSTFSGLRISLLLGIITSAICFVFGIVWGSISGYFGGNVDIIMERFCDILGGVPWIVVMTLCIIHLGSNLQTFALALCLTGWMGTSARTRTQFYRFKGREYILAARTLGASDSRLIFKHILPNAMGTIITASVLMIPSVIFSEATISYLGLGLTNLNSFGVILSSNQQYIQTHSALIVFPSVIMALLMISFNLFGNGLRDAFNPSLKGSE